MTRSQTEITRSIDARLRVLQMERDKLEQARSALTGKSTPRLSVNGRPLGRPRKATQ